MHLDITFEQRVGHATEEVNVDVGQVVVEHLRTEKVSNQLCHGDAVLIQVITITVLIGAVLQHQLDYHDCSITHCFAFLCDYVINRW